MQGKVGFRFGSCSVAICGLPTDVERFGDEFACFSVTRCSNTPRQAGVEMLAALGRIFELQSPKP